VLVVIGRYSLLEHLMKFFIGLMLLVVIACAVLVAPGMSGIVSGLLLPSIPEGSVLLLLGVIGGVGGSVTLLCYGYWIRERGWNHREDLPLSRFDLVIAYLLTSLFGIGMIIISSGIQSEVATGTKMVLGVAEYLESVIGPVGKWCFLIGFWSAVFSSMLGVWQGIPYLFADFVQQYTRRPGTSLSVSSRSATYRVYLFYIAIPPMLLLLVNKPVWLVILYAVTGAFFMPLLALLLLIMNNRSAWVGELKNGWASNLVLLSSLLVFGLLLYTEVGRRFGLASLDNFPL
jgi:Mn2+/Fe2+ NRAMP family transporter